MTVDSEIIVVSLSRLKAALLFLVSAAFVAIGIFMIGRGNLLGWAVAVFFVLGIPLSLYMLVPGAMELRIDRHGIQMKTLFRPFTIAWKDIDGFYVTRISNATMIGISYAASYDRMRLGRGIAAGLTGVEGALPNNFNMSAEDMCTLLNESKSRWGSQPQTIHSRGTAIVPMSVPLTQALGL